MATETLDAVIESKAQAPAAATLALGAGAALTCEQVEHAAGLDAPRLAFTDEARDAMDRSARTLRAAHERGDAVYGLTTGFGPLVVYAADRRAEAQGAGLIAHLGAGCGPMAAAEVVRATMILRAHTLGMGYSGVEPAAADALVALARSGVVPAVPEVGSVGASGDLIPLSHVGRVLMGQGKVLCAGGVRDALPALRQHGLDPFTLRARDALALVNGTTFMTAYAALAVARAERLITAAERLTGWLHRLLGCREQALDPRLHAARGHIGQRVSADHIREEAARFGPWDDATRPLQDVYSLRCAPQILGACRDNLEHARTLVDREIAGVSDNPVVTGTSEDPCILHGGNFQGQQIAFAADALNAALVQAAVLAERQLDVLVNPDLTGATLMLAWQPGATSGLAGAQITATAVVAEMRHHGGPAATASIPTNGRNQDIVSMGTMAARHALAQTDRLATVLAATALGAAQLTSIRAAGRVQGRLTPPPTLVANFQGLVEDRPLHDELASLATRLARQGWAP